MGRSTLTGKSGKSYSIHPREINWDFDAEADFQPDDKDVVLIVGRYDGDVFVPINIEYYPMNIIRYFRQRGNPDHEIRQTNATHYDVIHVAPHIGEEIVADLEPMYPRWGIRTDNTADER